MDWHLTKLDDIPSTMDWAREKVQQGAPDFTAVTAKVQTQGRGRQGRQWDSPEGNLYFSFLMRVPAEICGLMSLSLAIALHDALKPLVNADITLKWPNDVLIDGRKIAGILIEREGDAAVVGIGVNVKHAPEGRAFIGEWHDIDAEGFLPLLMAEIEKLYNQADPVSVIRRWNELAAYKGQTIGFVRGNEPLQGTFEGVDDFGHARIRGEAGVKSYASGEIMEVRPCC